MHLTVGRLEVNSPVCFSDFVLFSGIDAFSYWLLKLSLIVIELLIIILLTCLFHLFSGPLFCTNIRYTCVRVLY